MNADVFVDTNVLLYTIDEEPASAPKRQRAQQLLLSERWGWSIQVAAEFFVNAIVPCGSKFKRVKSDVFMSATYLAGGLQLAVLLGVGFGSRVESS
jgi:predicted nucleic acid-binding protein